MLSRLRIANLGVIEDAMVEPASGMTVVTGETGAGKTMIVTGLGLLLGQRADSGIVRVGAQRCVVEAGFTDTAAIQDGLDAQGAMLDDDELVVSRQVLANGRSRAWLGGSQVPLGRLGEITGELATIHGQAEQLRLGTPERQREVLDRSGGESLARVLARYRTRFELRQSLVAERAELMDHARQRARELDLLTFGLHEIAAVDPQPGEDVELATQARRLQAADDLRQLAAQADHALSGSSEGDLDDPGAIGLVGQARKAFDAVASLDDQGRALAAELHSLAAQTNDVAARVASYLADLDADPAQLEAITSRRAELAGLTRKYGETIDEVLAWARDASQRAELLRGGDERIDQLNGQIAELDEQLRVDATQLTDMRRIAADRLAAAAAGELAALAMPHAVLRFELVTLAQLGPWGAESVQLVFSANPGSAPGPLAKVASGGELSRVRLALEVVLADQESGHCFVFDEVDAGVGGAVATEIGRRLARLAAHSQVIVVTHLAQVAAFADRHYVVAKSDDGQVTTSDVREVRGAERVAELARMMAGLESDNSLAHARELLAQAAGAGS